MPEAGDAGQLDAIGLEALRLMVLIREFERRLGGYATEGLIRGSTHPSVGMEAVAVGVSLALRPQDCVVSNHRGHAHCLARGSDPGKTLAEILGREGGYCSGKGGSMHIAVRELGILGTNGVVGAGIGLATGAALAARLKGTDDVAVAYFGDGASNQGVFAESMNLAALWKLPVIFVCENNKFAQSARIEEVTAQPLISRRGYAYGIPSYDVDGMDVIAVHSVAQRAISRARVGDGPTLIVADTYRFLGHMADDTEIYRDPAEVEAWRLRDPIERLAGTLIAEGLTGPEDLERLVRAAADAVDQAEEFARSSPVPSTELAFADVMAPSDRVSAGA